MVLVSSMFFQENSRCNNYYSISTAIKMSVNNDQCHVSYDEVSDIRGMVILPLGGWGHNQIAGYT